MKSSIDEHRENMINWAKENGDTKILKDGKPIVTKVDKSEFDFKVNSLGWRWY